MNYSRKNMGTLLSMQGINEALTALAIDGDELVYGNRRVNISKFDIELLMGDSLPFESQLTTLTPEDVFKIISLHAITLESKGLEKEETKNETELKALQERNPKLSNIVISYRETPLGRKEEYINIVDSNGVDHLLHNVYNADIIYLYKEALNRYGSVDITPEQLFESFKRNCVEVSLEDTYDMTHREGTSKEFVTKMKDFESKHLGDKHYALGNEENDILISNDHTVTSYTKDEKGNLIQNDFSDSTRDNGEIAGSDGTSDNVKAEEETNTLTTNESEGIVIDPETVKAIDLISEKEFYELINSVRELTEAENRQLDLFNSYLEDLLLYKDYLLPELKNILARFEEVMEKFAVTEGLNSNQTMELDSYYQMQNNVEKRIINDNNVSLDNEIQRLKLAMPEQQGNVNPTAIILIMSGIVMLMGVIAVLLLK